MFDWAIYLQALLMMAIFAGTGWLISVARHNVTLVDSMWSLFFLLAALVYNYATPINSLRATLVTVLVGIWALRLAAYLSWRNRGPHEDRRYQAIRQNNEPHFWLKSLYIVFGL
ncbi:MAG TPA: DUF1295 domain-containing protein, partial [Methylophilaceae bacterium]|nr:DUF1295 domain-containing protein [Methylophilaceae bacterium]